MLDTWDYFVRYNASKTVAICYGNSGGKHKRPLRLDGECIRWEIFVKYFGNIYCSSMNNCNYITHKKRIYIILWIRLIFIFYLLQDILVCLVWKPKQAARYWSRLRLSFIPRGIKQSKEHWVFCRAQGVNYSPIYLETSFYPTNRMQMVDILSMCVEKRKRKGMLHWKTIFKQCNWLPR